MELSPIIFVLLVNFTLFFLLCSLWKFVVPLKDNWQIFKCLFNSTALVPFLCSMSGALLTSHLQPGKINEVTFASLCLSFFVKCS